jgi:hypothetical protein
MTVIVRMSRWIAFIIMVPNVLSLLVKNWDGIFVTSKAAFTFYTPRALTLQPACRLAGGWSVVTHRHGAILDFKWTKIPIAIPILAIFMIT